MARNLAFWEKKLEEAGIRLIMLTTSRLLGAALVANRIRASKKGNFSHRAMCRLDADVARSQLAKIDRAIKELKETKIPYYQARIDEGPKTSWERLRSGTGLRL